MVNDGKNDSNKASKKPIIRKSKSLDKPIDPDAMQKTIIRKAKTWDGILAKEAEFITRTESSFGLNKIRFDGASEVRGGTSSNDMKTRIASCREAYENTGIIGNIIDLMVDFALEQLEIYHKSKPIQKFFQQWAKKVELRSLSEQILKGIYRDGNVPVLSYYGKISEDEINQFKRSFGNKSTNSLFDDDVLTGIKIIPYRYKMLDIMNIDRGGNELLGDAFWAYRYNQQECKGILKLGKDDIRVKQLKKLLGDDDFSSLTNSGIVKLNPDKFRMLFYKKDGYRCWANPMLWRVMEDVKFKQLLRDMDISVAEGVTNALTIVKLGDMKAGLPPSKNKYTKITEMLKNPSKSKTIVWDDLIDVQSLFPPVDTILSSDKYQQVDNDIRSGLGIAEILVNGGGGNYSNSFLSVKTLLERLETGRQMLLEFLVEQIAIVSKNMGFRSAPHIRLSNMNLGNEDTEKKFILELFDRNALSYETMLHRFGENLDIEMQRIRDEDKLRKEIEDESPFALLRVGKFGPQYPQGPPSIMEVIKKIEQPEPKELPSGQEKDGKDGGSPTGPKKRKPQNEPNAPVGQKASFDISFSEEKIGECFTLAYDEAKNFICKQNGYKDARSMNNNDVDNITSLVLNNLVEAIIKMEYGDDAEKIMKTKESIKLNRCVVKITKQEIQNFISKNGRRPSKEKLKQIIKVAFTIGISFLK